MLYYPCEAGTGCNYLIYNIKNLVPKVNLLQIKYTLYDSRLSCHVTDIAHYHQMCLRSTCPKTLMVSFKQHEASQESLVRRVYLEFISLFHVIYIGTASLNMCPY